MATLINNSGVQYYANKMVQAENRKVGSKSLPTALNDIDSALDEMKILFDTEYGSALDMKLENTENIFSIGTGSGVDKKADVENSFTDVELKGNTLVNLFGGGFTYTSSIIKYLNGVEVSPNATARFDYASQLKKDVKYTAIVKVDQVSEKFSIRFHTANTSGIFTQIASSNMSGTDVQVSTTGVYKVLFTPQMDSIIRPFVWNTSESTINLKVAYILILEGDWTNKTTPDYFEGIKSVGEVEENKIEVLSVGKNIVNKYYTLTPTNTKVELDVPIKKGQKFYFKCDVDRATLSHFSIYGKNDKTGASDYHSPFQAGNTVVPNMSVILEAREDYEYFQLYSKDELKINEIVKLMITLSDKESEFELNKSDKKQILLNEPLRGVGDVKDTIEKVNGEWKIIRRCNGVLLDDSQGWHLQGSETLENTFLFSSADGSILAKNFPSMCNRFIASKTNLMADKGDGEGVGSWGAFKNINIRINKSRLSTPDAEGFKKWLKENPTTVIYELATPVVEDISPITLQAWKNGTISIDSIIPVESTHTVALNKPAQIKRNIEELTQLRNKVKSLEEQYDQIALEQAHQLELINHSFELDYYI